MVGLAMLLATSCGDDTAPAGTLAEAPLDRAVTTTTLPPAANDAPATTTAPPPVDSVNPGVVVTPRGVVVPVIEELPEGLRVRTPCGHTALLRDGTRIRTAAIVLDPGHGGTEPGAVSPDGMSEDGINLAISQRAKDLLDAAGISTVLTRTADYDVTLQTRAEIARNLAPRALLSIHHNAEPDGPFPRPGSETYYQIGKPDSKRLAGILYEELLRALSPFPASWVADTDAGAKYREGRQGDYYAVLRMPAPVTSVLSEAAFISNPEEAALMARADFQAAEAEAISRAVLRYLNTPDPGSGFVTPYPRSSPPSVPGAPPPPCADPAF